jgi:acyl-CoA dehydrogenase
MNEPMIEDSARRLYGQRVDRALVAQVEAGAFPQALWQEVVEAGFDAVLLPEAAGGIDGDWADAWPILHGLGRFGVPLPLAETMIGALLLAGAGLAVPAGPIAVIEALTDGTIAAQDDADGSRLSGRAVRVAWARHARWALVSLPHARIALVDLGDRASASVVPHSDVAGLPSDTVELDRAPAVVIAPTPLPALALPVRTLGAVARSVMIVGALQSALDQSVRYANDRVQFGKPIGRNQAIQHQLALFAGELESARAAARAACEDAPTATRRVAPSAGFGAAVAKICCGEAASRAAAIAHQVHGAIGFTAEHPLNLATRRLWAWRADFGSDAWWAERLGREAIAAGGSAFWPALTARRF